MSRFAIETIHLTKEFRLGSLVPWCPGRAKSVLRDVSFRVEEGETVIIAGENGAGKSTLLKILATILLPTSGEFRLWGKDVSDADARALRRRIGWVGDNQRSFFWRLTGEQNLRFFASLYGVPRGKFPARMGLIADVLGMNEYLGQPVRLYPKGMRQRLALARSMIHFPDLLLLDEPFQGLDDSGHRAFWEALEVLQSARKVPATLVVASPKADFPARVLTLSDGTLSGDAA